MGIARIMIIAIMAGIYSGILDDFQQRYGLNFILSHVILVLLTFATGYILYKPAKKVNVN
jgi:hypothetical protein